MRHGYTMRKYNQQRRKKTPSSRTASQGTVGKTEGQERTLCTKKTHETKTRNKMDQVTRKKNREGGKPAKQANNNK